MSDTQRADLDHKICQHILNGLEPHTGLRIAAYLTFRGEPDLAQALQQLHQHGHHVYLPVVDESNMRFRSWQPDVELQMNRFNIPEPIEGLICKPEDLDFVLLPLTAFDAQGNRLGMGGGYYDRCFAFRSLKEQINKPELIGTAYAAQQVEVGEIALDRWDIKLDGIVTEQGWQRFDPY